MCTHSRCGGSDESLSTCGKMSTYKHSTYRGVAVSSVYEWVMSHMNESCPIWMSHGPYEWVMSHMNESWPIWMSCTLHMQWSHLKHLRVTSNTHESLKTLMSHFKHLRVTWHSTMWFVICVVSVCIFSFVCGVSVSSAAQERERECVRVCVCVIVGGYTLQLWVYWGCNCGCICG